MGENEHRKIDTIDMANTTATYQMFNSAATMLGGCGLKVYLMDRPKETPSKTTSFAVVDFPVSVVRPYIGNDDFRFATTGVIYIFCRARNDGTPNIDAQTALVRKVTDCFPYKDVTCEFVNPSVLMRGADEYGFQVTTVTFAVRTRINSITNIQ